MPTPTLEELMKEFDEKFCSLYGINIHDLSSGKLIMGNTKVDEFKSFLTTVYNAGRDEDRKELMKKIEGMKKHSTGRVPKQVIDEEDGYNEALSDVIELIKSK